MDADQANAQQKSGSKRRSFSRMRAFKPERKEEKSEQEEQEKSEQEEQEKSEKSKQKPSNSGKPSVYDGNGCIRHNGLDVCDCMTHECPGCFFECEKCGSTKCGAHCRVNRSFYYDTIFLDGKTSVIENPYFQRK